MMSLSAQLDGLIPTYDPTPRVVLVMTAEKYRQLADEFFAIVPDNQPSHMAPHYRGVPIIISPFLAEEPGWQLVPRMPFDPAMRVVQ